MNSTGTGVPAAGAERREARLESPRLSRELKTIGVMLRIYCRDHHGAAARNDARLCDDCAALLGYARKRLAGCPYGPDKPTCANCQIHCYGPTQREAARVMMRYAGPRMIWRHPWLAIAHVLDGKRAAPPKPRAVARVEPAASASPPEP
jgi:Nitrous oxide-stimulated promoter